ncbi:MAG: hypothetical protein CML12_00970 [Puniceicoccaceae bacterium]|nr:hypothetical protein [Puniceicoccaceae bacterium]RCL31116.1 MAG: hypothetical protein DBX03_01320 [Puniceicoccaceae bacterium]
MANLPSRSRPLSIVPMSEPDFDPPSKKANPAQSPSPYVITLSEETLPEPSWLIRGIAFLMDYILVTLLATLLVVQVILPMNHSISIEALVQWLDSYALWLENASDQTMPTPNTATQEVLLLVTESFTLIFILYFFLCDSLFRGRSIGKKIFNIRVISTSYGEKIPFFYALIRSFSKTIMIFYFFPIIFILALLTKQFHKSRKWGHDLVSQTKVIDEYKFNQMLAEKAEAKS